jgi:hypothetical protein
VCDEKLLLPPIWRNFPALFFSKFKEGKISDVESDDGNDIVRRELRESFNVEMESTSHKRRTSRRGIQREVSLSFLKHNKNFI